MKDFDIFDHMDGIPDKESEKVRAQEVYKKVRNEFKKISKEDALGYSLQLNCNPRFHTRYLG